VFGGTILILKRQYFCINLPALILGFVLMVILSMLWGMFLNSLFLYSRDSSFLFTILEEPMEIFAGIKIPTQVFPFWARIISIIFPLTYSAEVLRRALLGGENICQLKGYFLIGLLWAFLMLIVTIACLYTGEQYSRKTGNMSLF
jgi:ABC-2 type transport system permease protein